jgi:UDP-glucuronate decarboxylase
MPLERNYADNKILVTGDAGFIGSHLCERLLAEGAEVICLDNYTGSRRNIAHLLRNPLSRRYATT